MWRVLGRHTALGDALVTGEIFLGLITLLQQRGVATLGEAVAASRATLQRSAGPVPLQLLTGSRHRLIARSRTAAPSNGVIFRSPNDRHSLLPMPAGDDAPEEP